MELTAQDDMDEVAHTASQPYPDDPYNNQEQANDSVSAYSNTDTDDRMRVHLESIYDNQGAGFVGPTDGTQEADESDSDNGPGGYKDVRDTNEPDIGHSLGQATVSDDLLADNVGEDPFASEMMPSQALPGGLFLSAPDLRVYERLWIKANGGDSTSNSLEPAEAVHFYRTSGLDDMTLGGIWQIADQKKRGKLTKSEFYLATKLVALCQQGTEPKLANINIPAAIPQLASFSQEAVKEADVGFFSSVFLFF